MIRRLIMKAPEEGSFGLGGHIKKLHVPSSR
jgi:hypothetical protein